jgi:hypothetical protein
MKIEIAKEDLQKFRNIVWHGRSHFAKESLKDTSVSQMCISKQYNYMGTKLLKKLNQALKKVHGHDCCGELYQ